MSPLVLRRRLFGVLSCLLLAPWLTAGAHAEQDAYGLRLYGADRTEVEQAPQLGTAVSMTVSGMVSRVRVVQRFRNAGARWVEGVYVFPLPEDAAVDRLQMRYAGRVIEGEIQERAQARRTYQQARQSGRGAGLLDQQRSNVFTTSVANIPPGETVEIAIEYQQAVRWSEGEFSLRFPTVVAPRYIPGEAIDRERPERATGWSPDTDQVADASLITPPVVDNAPSGFNGLTLRVELDAGLALRGIDSPYHPIVVEQPAPRHYRVRLADGVVPAERDFVLRWRPVLGEQPSAALFTETWEGHEYALLMLLPPRADVPPVEVARELVLVVDTSGSMHGESIAQARAALRSALRRLRPGDRFNIIQFNDRVDALFADAVPADPAHLARGLDYARSLQADGGTEMLPAMRRALRDPSPSGLLRQVVFITDGAVGNEQALFGAVSADLGASRLFTVGIGSAPNALFMRKAAAFGRGTFTYIGSTREVERQVDTLFRQLAAPVLTDVGLRWADPQLAAEPVQTPDPLPDLYAGEPLVVALRATTLPRRVEVAGRLGAQPWRHTVVLPAAAERADSSGVHALWARRLIDDWLARGVLGEAPEQVRAAVLQLALDHRLVSRYTSLVAVDRTPSRPATTDLASAALPVRLPAGWSAEAVFGQMPGTATPAPLALLLGTLALLFARLLAGRRR